MGDGAITQLLATLRTYCMVRSVDIVPKGHIRVETAFLYPDGSSVDVFLVMDPRRPQALPSKLSDFGETMGFLLHHEVKPWTTVKRSRQLQEAVSLYGVELVGGALNKNITDTGQSLRDGIVLLGQACVRMSDMLFTKRLQLQSVFTEEVEEFIADTDLHYEPRVVLPGRFAPIAVDFLVHGRRTISAVLTLFSRLPVSAHTQANEVFSKMHDLEISGRPEQRVTILDDSTDVTGIYRDEDLSRIAQYSTVLPFSDRDELRALLAA